MMQLFHVHWNQRWASAFLTLLLLFACRQIKASTCVCEQFGGCRTKRQCHLYEDQMQICNVALGKTAHVSTLFNRKSGEINEMSGPACLAVNGDNGTDFRPINKYPQDPNCVSTANNDKNPYWEVDLGENYNIVNIVVYGRREDKAKHLKYATVTVDNEWCYNFSSKPEIPTLVKCNKSLAGRLVKISKTRYDKGEYFLTLCEVQVWGNQNNRQVLTIISTNENIKVPKDTCDRTLLVASLVIIFILVVMLTLAAVFIMRQKKQLHHSRNAGNLAANRATRTPSTGGNNFLAAVSGSSSAAVSAEVCEAGMRCDPGPVYTNYENSGQTTNVYECLNAESDDNTASGYTTLMALM